ncbi:MAG: GNAT family N-acetyltransferase [Chloroflexota bacterium]
MTLEIREMTQQDEYFVSTCTHENESEEIDASSVRRCAWFHAHKEHGFSVKVALKDGERVGFAYSMPIEISPWGPLGADLLVIPCLFVKNKYQKQGIGELLVLAVEDRAKSMKKAGVVTIGYLHDFWFMPASFFLHLGYKEHQRRGSTALLAKLWDKVQLPKLLEPEYAFTPVEDKVVIDLYWNTFCATCDIEAVRVREVAEEFGDRVVLREFSADDRKVLLTHQIAREIYINGQEIGWGYEAPKEGLRKAINSALADSAKTEISAASKGEQNG